MLEFRIKKRMSLQEGKLKESEGKSKISLLISLRFNNKPLKLNEG